MTIILRSFVHCSFQSIRLLALSLLSLTLEMIDVAISLRAAVRLEPQVAYECTHLTYVLPVSLDLLNEMIKFRIAMLSHQFRAAVSLCLDLLDPASVYE